MDLCLKVNGFFICFFYDFQKVKYCRAGVFFFSFLFVRFTLWNSPEFISLSDKIIEANNSVALVQILFSRKEQTKSKVFMGWVVSVCPSVLIKQRVSYLGVSMCLCVCAVSDKTNHYTHTHTQKCVTNGHNFFSAYSSLLSPET